MENKLKIAFLSEMLFMEKVPVNHTNMRTEFAWMYALGAEHFPITQYKNVKGFNHIFLILPKGKLNLNAEGSKINNITNPFSNLYASDFIDILKSNNNKVHYVQEGPNWWFNDYNIQDQFNFFNNLVKCDSIFAHNKIDQKFYKGLFPNKEINIINTLLIEELIKHIKPTKEDKVIIGGNFARWYGGFQSYIVAQEFDCEKWTQESHAKREHEDKIPDLNHLQRLSWGAWMNTLSTFKYAVHLMPTVAAGTFSLNCAYFGIPCIGNKKVDTQILCHPELSVDVDDINSARELAYKLKNDNDFYNLCSSEAKSRYRQNYDLEIWKTKMYNILL
tara:strand:+ start:10550 stop:11545 length:996 start_codon:yes stop_codon:yes gene_type:complete